MNTRRDFIKSTIRTGGLLLTSTLLLSRCNNADKKENPKNNKDTTGAHKKGAGNKTKNGSSSPCSDVSGISQDEQEKRKKLGYVAKTPITDSKCSVCKLYLPPAKADDCGRCALFKGPVEADGYCAYFAPLEET
jgi:hypothetical protein